MDFHNITDLKLWLFRSLIISIMQLLLNRIVNFKYSNQKSVINAYTYVLR